jgi:hypothetical protein
MGVITLKIEDHLEERLRKKVGEIRGAERGAISQSVEEAIRMWLASPREATKAEPQERLYIATNDMDEKVAEAPNLLSLSKKLKEAKIDPRDVTVESIPKISTKRRMGLRTGATIRG